MFQLRAADLNSTSPYGPATAQTIERARHVQHDDDVVA
jgi:hypothetical protein